jgi:hypothetical protein
MITIRALITSKIGAENSFEMPYVSVKLRRRKVVVKLMVASDISWKESVLLKMKLLSHFKSHGRQRNVR